MCLHCKTTDTGWYWCGVEIDGSLDANEALYITVKSDPDLSVNESRVRGEEGGSVTVQCLYSAAYQNTQKQWCRFKDEQCNTVGINTFRYSTVYISDDGRRSFSVRMSRLKKSDTGWYWCSAGDLQVPVHISVSDPPPEITLIISFVLTTVTTSNTTMATTNTHEDNTHIGCNKVESMRTLKNVAVKRGGSVTIPCLYEEKYKANKKFWCKGNYWSTCSIVAYANKKKKSVNPSVIDHPEQNLFTVELNSVSESGTGWCAVEIGDKWQQDDHDHWYLTVSRDLSVRQSRVRGEEGGSITVQCLYSAAYQNTQKQWCRFKDGQCQTVRTETSQNSAVYISDDGRRSFSVKMSRLKKSDAGWYWCSAGDLQVPVHISVTTALTNTVTTTVTTTAHQDNTYTSDSKHISVFVTSVSSRNETTSLVWTLNHWYLVALLLPLVILVIIICMLRKKCELENQTRIRERSNDTTVPTSKKQATFTDEDSIIYSTVAKSKPKVSPNDVTNETLYSYEVYQ
ncbi:polymeric immunoglobulin receptor-like [Tachysurus fulvidraco]|uniref:polymeric immunoglobulin receptor-like n=1 Tax=Tachysurus fulvidraco TaxID=1234273 RepID=UPI001FEE2A97|nr:polymeric immunoglobulin receptor-like [Tachysurus fulvidraco]